MPKLRLWARMIASNLHEDLNESPDIPAFRPLKRSKKESLRNVVSGAAEAFAKAMGGLNSVPTSSPPEHTTTTNLLVELRQKKSRAIKVCTWIV